METLVRCKRFVSCYLPVDLLKRRIGSRLGRGRFDVSGRFFWVESDKKLLRVKNYNSYLSVTLIRLSSTQFFLGRVELVARFVNKTYWKIKNRVAMDFAGG